MLQDFNTRNLAGDAKFYEGYSRWNEVTQRQESWDDAVERVMTMHREFYKDKMTDELASLIDEAEKAYKQKKVLGAQRALQFGGAQLLKHQMRLYNCFDRGTRFITNLGIKSFKDYEDGDNVIVRSHLGNWKHAKVCSYGKQDLYEITFRNRQTVRKVKATKNHRWILEDGSVTTSLDVGDKLFPYYEDTFNQFDWSNSSPEEQLYWCYGFVYGDGSIQNGFSKVRLCDYKIRFLSRFESFGWKTTSPLSLEGDVYVFTGRYQKSLPSIERDGIALVRAFVRGYLDADGVKDQGYWTERGNRFQAVYAKSIESQNFIRDIFPAVGITVNSEKVPGITTEYGTADGVNFGISTVKRDSRKWVVEDISFVGNDQVWCLEVEDDQSFTLEGGIVTGNCVSSYADRAEFFGELFYVLLCGAGSGISIQKHHVAKLSQIQARKKQPKHHIIDDSIEGWATALDVLLSSYFVGGGKHPEYEGRKVYFDFAAIRRKNAIISGGFRAPGPEPLRLALDKIEYLLQGLVLRGKTTLRPIDVYDICMFIADAVLAGGVRRSATICLFSADDQEMIEAKTGNWFEENPQRGRSNNSAVIVRGVTPKETYENIFASIRQYGEPGFIFTNSTEHTYNPCVEIGKYPVFIDENKEKHSGFQGCNLVEINGSKCTTKEEFLLACKIASILGTLQAGYTDFKFVSDYTKKIFEREALLGVSITGWMNSPKILFDTEILKEGATYVREINRKVAKLIGINPAARTTCVKPSGNASVLLGTSSGIHGDHAPFYLRNIQINKDSPIAQILLKTNPYMIEESVWSTHKTDYVISFPVIAPQGSIFKNALYGVKLLEKVKLVQNSWVEYGTDESLCVDPTVRHNVSNTVQVAEDQWDEVKDYLFDNRDSFAGVSFISVSGDRDFAQAPFTEIISEKDIIKKYGEAALFASGLIVDTSKGFRDLWEACDVIKHNDSACGEQSDLRADWIRRFKKFSFTYFDGDDTKTEMCLKDVQLLHKWTKIQQNFIPINFDEHLTAKFADVDIDTMGAMACAGGACDIT